MFKLAASRRTNRMKSAFIALLFVATQFVFPFATSGLFDSVASAAAVCVNDTAGANDEPGQKDLTRLCNDESGLPTTQSLTWNWDDTGWSGNNTGDACALYDTDGDGNANYSVCVTVGNTPAVQAANSPRVYSCPGDSSIDKCFGAVLVASGGTTCTVSILPTQPFATGDNTPNDTVANCTVSMASVGGSSARLIDVCSYPSQQPNSDPSDCVIIQDNKLKLEVIKVINPTNDPGLFNLKIDGTTYAANVGNNGTTGEQILTAGTHVISETPGSNLTDLSAYTTNIVCKDGNGTGNTVASGNPTGASSRQLSVTVVAGTDVKCTITNTRSMGTITLVKSVVNDNGGSAVVGDFPLFVSGTPVTSGVALSVPTGTYTASETNQPGYLAGNWGGACTTTGIVTVTANQNVTCTITNNDIAPQLTIIKNVTNDNGGTKLPGDFTMNVSGTNVSNPSFAGSNTPGTTVTLNAGAYTVTESTVAGYAGTFSSDCTGSIAVGQTKTCTVTNDDVAPSLVLNKIVSNLYGGTATESNWTLTANGPTTISGLGAAGSTDVASGSTFKAGTYTLSENGSPSGYAASAWTCTNGVVVTGNQITLGLGNTTTCSITNSDIAPIIRIIKQVLNPYGGVTLAPDDFDLTLGGNAILSSDNNSVSAGSYVVGETQQPGYQFTSFEGNNCTIINGTMTALGVIGGTTICTITNTSIQPKLTLTKVIDGEQYGDATTVNDFGLTVGQTAVTSGVEHGYAVGSYALNEAGHAGYEFVGITGDAKCPTTLGGTVSLVLGDDITCVIHNKAQQPMLEVAKRVINDNGGTKASGEFALFVNGQRVNDPRRGGGDLADNTTFHYYESAVTGTPYTLTETPVNGYAASAVVCTYYGTETVVPHPVTLKLGDRVVCTITNNDVAPTLTLVKTVVNDNNGPATSANFQAKIDGSNVSWSTPTALTAGAIYTASETTLPGGEGYSASNWGGDCAVTGTVALEVGDNKTCTITNDDQPATLILVKNLPNDNGGTATQNDFPVFIGANQSSWGQHSVNAGSYVISETTLPGYTASAWMTDCDAQGNVTLTVGQTKTCTITNDDQAGSISGTKWEVDAFATNGTGATGLAGWTIYLDLNHNNMFDPLTESSFSDVTDVNGNYQINGLVPGTYEVREVNLADWTQIFPINISPSLTGELSVTLTQGQNSTHNDFGNFKNASISGFKWNDYNGDGQRQENESKLSNWTINLYDNEDELVSSQLTVNGDYKFTSLVPGSYKVCETNQTGWSQTFPLSNGGCHLITVAMSGHDYSNNNFGNQGRGSIKIVKDAQPNSTQSFDFTASYYADDENYESDQFSLIDDGDNTSAAQQTYEDLASGYYHFSEEALAGWTLSDISCDSDSSYLGREDNDGVTVNLQPGENVTCTFINTRDTGTITVNKDLTPSANLGKFNLLINGVVYAVNVGDGGTTGSITMPTGSYSVSELGGTNTSLGDYESAFVCTDGDMIVTNGEGTLSPSFALSKGQNIVCTFANNKGEILGEVTPTPVTPAPVLVNTGTSLVISTLAGLFLLTTVGALAVTSRRRTL